MATQTLWQQAQARVHALRGQPAEAEHFAHEAISQMEDSDDTLFGPDAWVTLGEVLALGRKSDEAKTAFEEALGRYERKGNLVLADRTRRRLTELRTVAT